MRGWVEELTCWGRVGGWEVRARQPLPKATQRTGGSRAPSGEEGVGRWVEEEEDSQ